MCKAFMRCHPLRHGNRKGLSSAQQPQAEDAPGRDSYWYGQLLYGSVAEGARYRSPGLAIGHRREREHLALAIGDDRQLARVGRLPQFARQTFEKAPNLAGPSPAR